MTDDDRTTDPAAGDVRADRSGALDIPSLVAGLVLAVLCAAFAFGDLDSLGTQARVVAPTVLLGVGVALLATSRRR